MTRHLDILKRAHQALLEARSEDCERAIIEFEALCQKDPLDPACLQACREQLEELQGLAKASAEGVILAREALLQAMETAGQLTTYDAKGALALRVGQRPPGPAY